MLLDHLSQGRVQGKLRIIPAGLHHNRTQPLKLSRVVLLKKLRIFLTELLLELFDCRLVFLHTFIHVFIGRLEDLQVLHNLLILLFVGPFFLGLQSRRHYTVVLLALAGGFDDLQHGLLLIHDHLLIAQGVEAVVFFHFFLPLL